MGLFDHFPYTNVHELNLDWILSMMKALEAEWEAFTAGNSLTFADPMLHDVTKTYAKNTIVLDDNGNAYVSLQAVPVGVGLQNGDYWLMVFDYEAFIEKVNKNFTANYYRGSYRATAAMAIGDWLTVDDVLCKATAAIAADDVLEVGTNIEHFTLEDFIKAFMQSANQLIQQYKNDIDASELAYRQQLAQDIANTTASLQTQLNQAISGATSDSEVINARVGFDNTVYATLGEAIRTQISNIMDNAGYDEVEVDTNGYINLSGSTTDFTVVSASGYKCAIYSCTAFDMFMIKGIGTNAARLWAFTDDAGNILLKSTNQNAGTDAQYPVAPYGATKLIINTTVTRRSFKILTLESVKVALNDIHTTDTDQQSQINDINTRSGYDEISVSDSGYIATNGDTTDFTVVAVSGYIHTIYDCSAFDMFMIKGIGTSIAKLWAFTDDDGNILSSSSNQSAGTDPQCTYAPYGATKLIINSTVNRKSYKVLNLESLKATFADIQPQIDTINNRLGYEVIPVTNEGWINTNVNKTDFTVNSASGYLYTIYDCEQYDMFMIYGIGTTYARLWAFTDDDGYILSSSSNQSHGSDPDYAAAPYGATKLIINTTVPRTSYKIVTSETIKAAFDNININDNGVNHLNILFMGDSIFGNDGEIVQFTHEMTKANTINCAFGGTSVAINPQVTAFKYFDALNLIPAKIDNVWTDQDAAAARLEEIYPWVPVRLATFKAVDMSTIDLLICNWGTNDYTSGQSLQDIEDAYTSVIGMLREAYPALRILVCTPIWRYFTNPDTDSDSKVYNDATLKQIAKAIENLMKDLRVTVFNAYENIPLTLDTADTYFDHNDKTHLNATGNKVYAHYINGMINNMY